MRAYRFVLSMLPLLVPSVLAAELHPLPEKVQYSIRARVEPDSMLIRGSLELICINETDAPLTEFVFALDGNATQAGSVFEQRYSEVGCDRLDNLADSLRGYCRLDSLLYQNAPLPDGHVRIDDTRMSVRPEYPLAPGERTSFYISFTSRLPGPPDWKRHPAVLARGWYPRLVAAGANGSVDNANLGWRRAPGEWARVDLTLLIDTAFHVLSGGKLMNWKDVFGLQDTLPDDSVYVDLRGQHSFGVDGSPYLDQWDSGLRRYVISEDHCTDFPLVICRGLILDWSPGAPSLLVGYSSKRAPKWASAVARTTRQALDRVVALMGRFPYSQVTIAAIDSSDIESDGSLITLPSHLTNPDQLRCALMRELLRAYIRPHARQTNVDNWLFGEGAVYYLTTDLLRDSIRFDDPHVPMRRYEDWWKGHQTAWRLHRFDVRRTDPYRGLPPIDSAWLAEDIDLLDRYMAEVYREIPAKLHALSSQAGRDTLLDVLREWAAAHRFDEPSAADFRLRLADRCGARAGMLADYWNGRPPFVDLSVDARLADADSLNGEPHILEIDISCQQLGGLSVDYIVIDRNNDTTAARVDWPDSVVTTLRTYAKTPDLPNLVIIDPWHALPDSIRTNNYWRRMPFDVRYLEPQDLYLGYRKF